MFQNSWPGMYSLIKQNLRIIKYRPTRKQLDLLYHAYIRTLIFSFF